MTSQQNWVFHRIVNHPHKNSFRLHTTPAAPAVRAIGAVTALSPDEHMTGILTALEIEYADASVGAAWINNEAKQYVNHNMQSQKRHTKLELLVLFPFSPFLLYFYFFMFPKGKIKVQTLKFWHGFLFWVL